SAQTAPLPYCALDIPCSKHVVSHAIAAARILNQRTDHSGGTGTVMDRHAHSQVAGMIGSLIYCLTERAESSAEWRIFTGKARAGAQIGEIKNQVIKGIGFVLQARGNRQSFAGLEKPKDNPTAGRSVLRLNQAQPAPCIRRRIYNFDRLIVLQLGAVAARNGQSFALWWIDQGAAQRIAHRLGWHFRKIDARRNYVASPDEF